LSHPSMAWLRTRPSAALANLARDEVHRRKCKR
jgi:hypothetical protein